MERFVTRCPSCGWSEVGSWKEKLILSTLYGPAVECEITMCRCPSCNIKGDFEHVNDAKIEAALRESAKASVPRMIDILLERGWTYPAMDRVLELPQGTIRGWREKEEPTREEILLLQFLVQFPQILPTLDHMEEPMHITIDPDLLYVYAQNNEGHQFDKKDLRCRVRSLETDEGYPTQGRYVEIYALPNHHIGTFPYLDAPDMRQYVEDLLRGQLAQQLDRQYRRYQVLRRKLEPLGILHWDQQQIERAVRDCLEAALLSQYMVEMMGWDEDVGVTLTFKSRHLQESTEPLAYISILIRNSKLEIKCSSPKTFEERTFDHQNALSVAEKLIPALRKAVEALQ